MTTGNHLNTARRARPTITLSEEDYERLSALAYAARNKQPELAAELAKEVARARVRAKGEPLEHFVSMNSEVEFRDDTNGKVRKVTLVFPDQADILQGKISVMTPGTDLTGLRTGHTISWETPAERISD